MEAYDKAANYAAALIFYGNWLYFYNTHVELDMDVHGRSRAIANSIRNKWMTYTTLSGTILAFIIFIKMLHLLYIQPNPQHSFLVLILFVGIAVASSLFIWFFSQLINLIMERFLSYSWPFIANVWLLYLLVAF